MYNIIILMFISQVTSLNICSVCLCQYKNNPTHDFQGEAVDCTYKVVVFKENYTLPNSVYSLSVASNNLTKLKPWNIFKSNTMTELSLARNKLKEINITFDLPELKILDLSWNSIETIGDNTFRNNNKLENLDLSNNKLRSVFNMFHNLIYLKVLVLDNNDLGDTFHKYNLFDPNGFGLNRGIQSLSISGVNLNVIPENFFAQAFSLKTLIISNNNLAYIFELPYTLNYLDISHNAITEISMEDFVNCPALKVLKLNDLYLKEIPDYVFKPLGGLVKLELERNRYLTQFSMLAFGEEVLEDADDFNLEVLSLKGSRVSQLNERLRDPFGRLTRLNLQGNPWKCDCELLWLKQLNVPLEDSQYLRCATPKHLRNKRISDIKDEYFVCPTNKHFVGAVIAVFVFCVILTITAVWLFTFIPTYQSRGRSIQLSFLPYAEYTVLSLNQRHPAMTY